jgi:V8-like Glu-specific endopeptidase
MIGTAQLLLASVLALPLLISPAHTNAQVLNSLKRGVVRVENGKFNDVVGTGFITSIVGRNVYIITAAHVVKGSQSHRVYLYSQPHDSLTAEVLDRQTDDGKGLALLLLKTSGRVAVGLTAIRLGSTSNLGNGESVKIIGFPGSTTIWTVDSGSVKRLQGSDLVLSGTIREGNSGGPVIMNQQAIGLITEILDSDAYATRAEVIAVYVNGIVSVYTSAVDASSDNATSTDGFCETLHRVVDASRKGFSSLKGVPINSKEFDATIKLPGATFGKYLSPNNVRYRMLTDANMDTVESRFHSLIPKVRSCLPKWEENEVADATYRYHKYRKEAGGVVISLFYNPVAQRGNHFLILEFAIPSPSHSEW